MSENITISLLNLLSKPEQTAFGKYLKSPFFSNKKQLQTLFGVLRQGGRIAEAPEAAFTRVFPGETFDQHKWNKALSDLNACIRDFLAVRYFRQHPVLYPLADAAALAGRGNQALFERAARTVLDRPPGKTAPDNTDSWWLRYQTLNLTINPPTPNRTKGLDEAVQDLETTLDTYYYISKLRLACERLAGAQILNWNAPSEDIASLLTRAQQIARAGESPLLQTYCLLAELLTADGGDFDAFCDRLEQYCPQLDTGEQRELFIYAFNFCTAQIRRDSQQAITGYLRLFDLSAGRTLTDDTLWEDVFLSFGGAFAMTGKKNEFDQLIRSGSGRLPAERREDAQVLLSAAWHFFQHDYAQAQAQLVRITTRHPRYALMYHALAARNTYMLSIQDPGFGIEQVHLALTRFSDFLKRQTMFSPAFCRAYAALIWFVRKMCDARTQRRPTVAALRRELEKRQPASRDWILAALDQLPD